MILPRLVTPTWGRPSYGGEVARWAADHLGLELMPWQKQVLDGQLEHDEDGRLAHSISLVSVARQNGKTTALKALVGWAVTEWHEHLGEPATVITAAHNLNLAEALFAELMPLLENRFGAISYKSSGRQQLTIPGRGSWYIQAARPGSFHGRSPHLIILDELWAIGETIVFDGALPSQRARKTSLMSCWSTAGTEESTAFQRLRTQGLKAIDAGKPTGLYMAEWSPSPDANVNAGIEVWKQANPALGNTITVEKLEEEARETANRAAWLRGSLNLWVASASSWLEPGIWTKREIDEAPDRPADVLAIEVDVDGMLYGAVAGWKTSDVEVVVSTAFIASSAEECWARAAEVHPNGPILYGASLELTVPPALRRRAQKAGIGEIQKWTSPIRTAILEGRLQHTGDEMLAEHVTRAVAKKINQGQALVLSTNASPGPIVLCRAMVYAAASCLTRPAAMRPAIYSGRPR